MSSHVIFALTVVISWTLVLQQHVAAGSDYNCLCSRLDELQTQIAVQDRYIAKNCDESAPETEDPLDDDADADGTYCSCERQAQLERELAEKETFISEYCPRTATTTELPYVPGTDDDDDVKSCPEGYESLSADDDFCYKILTVAQSWDQGQASCKADDGRAHLAYIRDADMNTAIVDYLLRFKDDDTCKVPNTPYWSYSTCGQLRSLTDCSTGFQWKLNSTKSYPVDFGHWKPNEPNCGATLPNKGLEACIQLRCHEDEDDCLWNDYQCFSPVCALCQLEL